MRIALVGEDLGEDKTQEGHDWEMVLTPPLSARTLKGSKAVRSKKGISPTL